MPKINDPNTELYGFLALIGFVILFGLLIALCIFINKFSTELRYLNIQINRAEGRERKYWIRKRRRLWLSLIPFIKY